MMLLVTGGAGFIGSNFIRYWLQKYPHDTIINLDALTYAGCRESLADIEKHYRKRYRFVRGNIADFPNNLKVLKKFLPDSIINFAAESHNSRAVLNPNIFIETNVVGTQRLIEAARRVGTARFHHISTCEVYGDLPLDSTERFTEESPYRPRTPYNASKAAADLIVRAYHSTYNFPVTISNASNNYGPYQFPEKVIPYFTIRGLSKRKLPLYKQSKHKREWTHVLDHCRALELVLLRGTIGETYNVGTGTEADIETIADKVIEALGLHPSHKTYVEDRPGHDRRYLLDSTKLRTSLGWEPQINFHEGMRDTIQWYVQNEAWWRPLLSRLEINEDSW